MWLVVRHRNAAQCSQDSHAQLQWQAEAEKRVQSQQRHLNAVGRQLEAARAREVALQTKLDACEAHTRRADAQATERLAAADAGRATEARAAAQSALVAEALRNELGEPPTLQVHDQPAEQQVHQRAEKSPQQASLETEHVQLDVQQARHPVQNVQQPVQEQLPPPPQPLDEVQAETPLGQLETETTSLKVASLTRHVESMELHIDSLEQQLDHAELHVAGVRVRLAPRARCLSFSPACASTWE